MQASLPKVVRTLKYFHGSDCNLGFTLRNLFTDEFVFFVALNMFSISPATNTNRSLNSRSRDRSLFKCT